MEMDKLGCLTSFIHNIVVYNIPLLYGTVGEIVVEKSGSLTLGVEGIMAVGALFGYIIGCYTNSMAVGIFTAFLAAALMGLLFAALTVSLQANQNITGLTLTTFGLGVYFFVGNGVKAIAWPVMNDYANIKAGFADIAIPGLSQIPVLGKGLFSHNMLVFVYLRYTKHGYEIAVVGDSAGSARYAGMKVNTIVLRTVFLSAALIGLAAAFKVGPAGILSTAITNDVGWTGIIVAWLSQLNTAVIFVVSALISVMHYGSTVAAATFSQVDSSFANMLQGVILFLVLAADFLIRFRVVIVKKGGNNNANG